jgi:hypothetical protein
MNNPETQATFGTRHKTNTNKRKYTTKKTKKMSNTGPIKRMLVKAKQFPFLIRHP